MDDIRIMAAVFVVIASMGVRMELTPTKVAALKNPVEKLVEQQLKKGKEQQLKEEAIARGEKPVADGKRTAAEKAKERAASGGIDDSTEKALNELEGHGDAVQKKLGEINFGGGGGDQEPGDDDEKEK